MEEADGVRFITMELVRGKTLSVAVHRPTLREFFDIAVPLADALSAAHQQGIVHRDLEPDDIRGNDRDQGEQRRTRELAGQGQESPPE